MDDFCDTFLGLQMEKCVAKNRPQNPPLAGCFRLVGQLYSWRQRNYSGAHTQNAQEEEKIYGCMPWRWR